MMSGNAQGVFRSQETGEVFARDSQGRLCRLGPKEALTWSADERHRRLAGELARFGLWDHLPDPQRSAAIAETEMGYMPFHTDYIEDQLEFSVDGEDLAEGGVEDFLAELAPALQRYGVPLQVETIEVPYRPPGVRDYIIAINS
jgi:hypothetical protein